MSHIEEVDLASQPNFFDDAAQKEIDAWKAEQVKADAEILKLQEKLYQPLYAKRAEIVSKVPNFWPYALANCEQMAPYFDDVDQPLLAKLKTVDVTKDLEDPRICKITFTFHDNDFLSENTLVKEFVPKEGAAPLGHEDFEWTEDLLPKKTEIQWKSDEVNLCKKKPTTEPQGDDDDEFEPGSFFSSFFDSESPAIASGIAQVIASNFFPIAVDWFTGDAIGAFDSLSDFDVDDDDEDDDDEDESDDDGAAEIDLDEKDKPSKRAKTQK
ncbi:unnamed protein product [Parajaminaea phylloscopi]